MAAYADRNILVTGAGGTIGSELCRQLMSYRPRKIVLFEVSEVALYDVDRELRERADIGNTEIVPVLGTVTDSRAARSAMTDHGIEVVLHAAAYKHVPLVEANPIAGMSNNVLGTRTLADAADEAGVERFILISTDKAVRPTNVMGASKRLAELVIQDLAKRSRKTVFSMVRFGNVLGSSGSVVPLFKEQIAKGGPITLTHDDVTRYFMTISEAVRLVLLAGSFSHSGSQSGGDVFVLDMGKPMRIRDLAEQMVQAAGYTVRDAAHPEGDIEITMIGLRPGEKLHEELLIGEGLLTTPHSKILRAREVSLSELDMAKALQSLRNAMATGDAEAARSVARAYVEGFGANSGLREMQFQTEALPKA
jgi:FlaA1/EpsC-like NDP-sugar epimerase